MKPGEVAFRGLVVAGRDAPPRLELVDQALDGVPLLAELGVRGLERLFRLDAKALGLARAKRRPATRLGWAVWWGTVRMLGTFLIENPTAVPASVVRFVADAIPVPSCLPGRTRVRIPVLRPAAQGRHLAERGKRPGDGAGRGVVVPGMLRDSLFILDAIHARPRRSEAGDRHHGCRLVFRHRLIAWYHPSPLLAHDMRKQLCATR
ncbi:DUF4158 domain-containing protein [Streptomyces sp. MK37H]|nr:DUF4158 domain-containing protein [Streptomyces sp. MK37H]